MKIATRLDPESAEAAVVRAAKARVDAEKLAAADILAMLAEHGKRGAEEMRGFAAAMAARKPSR